MYLIHVLCHVCGIRMISVAVVLVAFLAALESVHGAVLPSLRMGKSLLLGGGWRAPTVEMGKENRWRARAPTVGMGKVKENR